MKNIIEVKNLTYSYNNFKNILEDISFSIEKKDLVAIIGHNGSGKSTLIKLILGLIEKNKGEINTFGKLAYIPQKYNQDSNFPAKVEEIFSLECCDCDLRLTVLENLGVQNLLSKQFKNLSGGQQQRVLIALSLLSNPEILVLDEPTIGVDKKTLKDFYNLLKKLNEKRNLTILFVTHDTGMISSHFNKMICVENRKVYVHNAKNASKVLNKIYGEDFHKINHHHHKSEEEM